MFTEFMSSLHELQDVWGPVETASVLAVNTALLIYRLVPFLLCFVKHNVVLANCTVGHMF